MTALPPELEQNIFELVALADFADTPRLALVARRVWAWTEPILYRTATIDNLNEKKGVAGAIHHHLLNNTRTSAFFHRTVKNFYIFPHHWLFMATRPSPNSWKPAELARVLHACTGVENLLVMSPEDKTLDAMSAWRPSRAAVLDFFSAGPMDVPALLARPQFQGVTHLAIAGMQDRETLDYTFDRPANREALVGLRGLRGLALMRDTPQTIAEQVLEMVHGLEMLLLCAAGQGEEGPSVRWADDRVVLVADSLLDDWAAGAWGEPDMWGRAEEFVQSKRRGEVDASCFDLPPRAPQETVETTSPESRSEYQDVACGCTAALG
ncbi:hypothetical protein MKEN_00283200 [Mycena kentingensis (nom. inval.)]|nr:hypothetical protein MKEN_00283200 [Mycena kentingensis (nom. inval.)]